MHRGGLHRGRLRPGAEKPGERPLRPELKTLAGDRGSWRWAVCGRMAEDAVLVARRHDLVPRALASHHRPLSRGEGQPRGLGPQLPLTLPWLGESRLLWLPKPRPSGRVLSRRPEAGERWPRARGISHTLPLRPLCAPSQSRKKPSESREQGTREVRTELPSPKHRWEDGRDRAGAARHRQHRPHRRPLRPRPPRTGPHGVGGPRGGSR